MIALVDPIGFGLHAALAAALRPTLDWLALVVVLGVAVVATLVARAERARVTRRYASRTSCTVMPSPLARARGPSAVTKAAARVRATAT
jgi:hypothetical protein